MTEQTSSAKPYASAHGFARTAAILLGIFAFVSVPLVGLSLSNIRVFQVLESASSLLDPAEPGERDVTFVLSKAMQAVLAVGDQFSNPVRVLGLVAAVACIIWIYRVSLNLPALGARNIEFTPEWAVGWWFIPIAHLFRPYQVVREIWQASDPGESGDKTLEVGPSNALLGWWWALVVSGLVLAFYYPFWAKITEGTVFGVATTIDAEFYIIEATNAALNIAAAVLGILVVLKVDDMQTMKHRQLAAREAPSPSPPPPEVPGYEQG